jgi:hypothetical protein
MAKLDKMSRYLPGLYRPESNVNVRGLLSAWSSEDDRVLDAIRDAKEQIFVQSAQLQYLDALGSNVGVFRPTEFNLADNQYRQLIPALSFFPKQVKSTIQTVLDIFFDPGNPSVQIAEVNPNEVVIQIPSSVPSLRRTLKGSHHFKAYAGTIVSIDNIFKEMVIDLIDPDKNLLVDEWDDAIFGQELNSELIASNTAGNSSITVQFFAGADLSVFSTSKNFNIAKASYPGSFMPDPTSAFSLTGNRGILGQTITAGDILPTITMTEASGIPDAVGKVVFNFGRQNQEELVSYFGRPNNSTLLLDPSYTFLQDHAIGEPVNVVLTPYIKPDVNGDDFSIYLVGVLAARILAQQIIESIVAAGVVVRWIIIEPEC